MPTLAQVVAAPPPTDVPTVVARLAAIDACLPAADGIAWFTKLYLHVTEAVEGELAGTTFRDRSFLAALDVAFANLYLTALQQHVADPTSAPRAWAPLFACRRKQRIAPIQFALAGMNAHINRDLPVALVRVCEARGVDLLRARGQHADFLAVNGVLRLAERKVKRWFATGFVGTVDIALGSADDRIAMWDVGRARDAAWVNAQLLWTLRATPTLARRYLDALDRSVGFAGRGLLVRSPEPVRSAPRPGTLSSWRTIATSTGSRRRSRSCSPTSGRCRASAECAAASARTSTASTPTTRTR